jgi:hypothetical protein
VLFSPRPVDGLSLLFAEMCEECVWTPLWDRGRESVKEDVADKKGRERRKKTHRHLTVAVQLAPVSIPLWCTVLTLSDVVVALFGEFSVRNLWRWEERQG